MENGWRRLSEPHFFFLGVLGVLAREYTISVPAILPRSRKFYLSGITDLESIYGRI
jgi:hypothetical protein